LTNHNDGRAIRLSLTDTDLSRSRLTVAFRLFLAIPHLFWLGGWVSVSAPVVFLNWVVTLVSGKPAPDLHRFLAHLVRYATHVVAYLSLAANPYPRFFGQHGTYPVEVDFDPPGDQNRWTVGFRLFLALPAVMLADSMLGFGTTFAGGAGTYFGGVVATTAFLAWFYCLVNGRMAAGLRDLEGYLIGYSAQAAGYLFLLTDRYPTSDPEVYEAMTEARRDPIRLQVDDDLRRSRVLTFFRLPLSAIHFVWIALWGIAALFASLANWVVALVRGRPGERLHRFLGAYVRYVTHVGAFVQLVANPFPGFTGRPGGYPVDVEIGPPERQSRWSAGFRLVLALPALSIAGALSGIAYLAAFYSWFHALLRGRVPEGLRNLGAFELRYNAQALGYLFLLTDRYPDSGPAATARITLAPAPRAAT
jgi:hypothetical protein